MPAQKKLIWKKYLRLIRRFDGPAFASLASLGSRLFGGTRQRITFDPAARNYVIEGPIRHRFVHKARIAHLLCGLQARGHILGDEYLLKNVEFEENDLVIDCGANIGDFGLYFAEIRTKIRMIAFEPSPIEYEALCENLEANPFTETVGVYNVALWDKSEAGIDFYVKSESADSSVVPISDYDRKITVPCKRLDEILPRQHYRLLKLEAEGAEPEILRGASGIIDCFDYVTVDAGFERGVNRETTAPDVIKFLFAHGFEVIDLAPRRLTLLFRRAQ